MRTLGRIAGRMLPVWLGLFCAIEFPHPALADGNEKNESKAPTKIEAPAPLTERERWLLDRMEQLEKRVAELEAVRNTPAPPSTEIDASQPVRASSVPVPTPENVGSVGAGTARAASASVAAPGLDAIAKNPGIAVSRPQATEKGKSGAAKRGKEEPFAFADFTWLNGNARTKESPMDTKFFTPEIRADVDYNYSFNHPKDDTIGGSSEVFRHGEVHVTQLGVGGDFHYDNVRARLMTQFGLYSQTTPRNDASPARGQWNLDNAYRYVSEAYGGYHFNALHGINVDASTWMRESSCPTSDFSVTTNSTTGRTSRHTFLRIRRGFSTACACRFSQQNI